MQAASAVGIRAHSGWAALVTIAGTPPDIHILDRRRVEICDPSIPGAKQPYHFVQKMDLAKAGNHLDGCAKASQRLAESALRELTRRYSLIGASILLASGRTLPLLPAILASHALIHTAEGEFFRRSFQRACAVLNITVEGVRERDLAALTPPAWQSRITQMGKVIGPPWTQDHKLAALAACLILSNEVQKHTSSPYRLG